MFGLEPIGKSLFIFGGILIFFGVLALVAERLPGSPVFRKRNLGFYLPVVIAVFFSIILAILLNVTVRIFR